MRPTVVTFLFLFLLLGSGAGEPMMVGPAWNRFQGRTRRLAARRGAALVMQLHLWLVDRGEMMWHRGPWTRAFWCGQQPRRPSPSSEFFPTCTTSPMSPDYIACESRSSNFGWDARQDNGYCDGVLDVCYPPIMVTQAYNGVFSKSSEVDNIEHCDSVHGDPASSNSQLHTGQGNASDKAKTGTVRDAITEAIPATGTPSVFRRATEDVQSTMRSWTTDWKLIENAPTDATSLARVVCKGIGHGLTPLIYAADTACNLISRPCSLTLLVLLVLSLPACAAHAESDHLAPQHDYAHSAHTLRFSFSPKALVAVFTLMVVVQAVGALCYMMPATAAVPRMPPAWDPSNQAQYPFRRWSHDVMVWSVATEGDPARKAALLCMSLRGSAQELVRTLPPAVLVQGGLVNGAAVDPLSFIMHQLAERFAALGEEVRLTAVTELLTFERQGAETVDNIINRFDVVRQLAHDQGQLVISVTGLTWLLLRAIGVSDQQLLTLLAPFNGVFPQNEAQLSQLKTQLRRMGHVLEHAPGNIASSLRSQRTPGRQNFWAHTETETPSSVWHATEGNMPNAWDTYPEHGGAPNTNWETESAGTTAWLAQDFEISDGNTDTDTSSSDGATELPACTPEGSHDDPAIGEHLFWAYQRAKSQWRRCSQKPTRTVRRHVRRFIRNKGAGKGYRPKGKGKGRPNPSAFLASLSDEEVQQVFKVAGKGKGKGGKRSTGKGKGRRTNPKGKDGMTMRCFRCGSETHLSRDCHLPRDPNQGQNSTAAPSFHVNTIPEGGPLSMVFMASPSDDSWSMPSEAAQAQPDPWAEFLRGAGAFDRRARSAPADPPPGFDRAASGLGAGSPADSQSRVHGAAAPPMQGGPPPPPMFSGIASTMPMYVAQPPPSLPAWALMPEFSFVQQPLSFVSPEHEPLIPVQDGRPSVRSTLEPTNAQLVDSLHAATEASTLRWLNKSQPAHPTTQVTSQLHEIHHPSMESFVQAQRVMHERRAQAKRAQRALHLPRTDDLQAYDEQGWRIRRQAGLPPFVPHTLLDCLFGT